MAEGTGKALDIEIEILMKEVTKNVASATSSLDKLKKSLSGVTAEASKPVGSLAKMNLAMKSLNSSDKTAYMNFRSIAMKITGIAYSFKALSQEAIDFQENLNLFAVAMGDAKYEAMKFQNTLNTAFGTNVSKTIRYQGMFMQLASGMGMARKESELLSKEFTKLTLDMASFYNISQPVAFEKLSAGIAGQTKPLRTLGIDITEASLRPIAQELGVETNMRNMSQASKIGLRYIAIMRQSANSHGDFANTIQQPSNQLRIFYNLLAEVRREVGNLFINTFAKILPYINAVLIVVKQLVSWLGMLIGVDTSKSVLENANKPIDGIGASADSASGKVKALKNSIRGFDELNIVGSTQDAGSSGGVSGGGGLIGGIDPKIAEAMKEYDNLMSKVNNKASDMAKKMLKWLGFTVSINEETGKLQIALDDGYTNLEKIRDVIIGISSIILISRLAKLYALIKGIFSALVSTKAGIALKGISTSLGAILKGGTTATFALSALKKQLSLLFLAVSKVVAVIGGIFAVFDGAVRIIRTWNNMLDNSTSAMKNVAIGMAELVGGGAAIGLVFGGPVGAVIGALTGALTGLIITLKKYSDLKNQILERDLFGEIFISEKEWSASLLKTVGNFDSYSSSLSNMKDNIVSLAKSFDTSQNSVNRFSYMFSLTSKKISKTDAQNIKDSISDMAKSSSEIIDTTTSFMFDVWSDTFNKISVVTEEEEKNILKNILDYGKKQKNEIADAQKNITKTYDFAIKTRGYLTDEEYKYISEQLRKIKELTHTEITNSQATLEYLNRQFADKNVKLSIESYSEYKKAYDTYKSEQQKAIEDDYTVRINQARKFLQDNKEKLDEYNAMVASADKLREQSAKNLEEELNKFNSRILSNATSTYQELETKSDDTSKKQKKKLENIFNDLDFNPNATTNKNIENSGIKLGRLSASSFINIANSEISKWQPPSKTTTIKANLQANQLSVSNSVKNSIKDLFSVRISSLGINTFATGGFPSQGQMFMAREAGPELVGNIGNKTAVANNDQIVKAVSEGVAKAVSSVMGSGSSSPINITVQIGEEQFIKSIINGINDRTRQTNQFVFDVPL